MTFSIRIFPVSCLVFCLLFVFSGANYQSFAQHTNSGFILSSKSTSSNSNHNLNTDYSSPKKTSTAIGFDKQQGVPDKRGENIFFEGLGAGIGYSLNYDRRFGQRRDGLGGRIGFAFVSEEDQIYTIPVEVNCLFGEENKFFEVGAGVTFTFPEHDYSLIDGSSIVGVVSVGYRRQPADGGFLFRATFTPLITKEKIVPYSGLSFGYTF